MGIYEDGCQYCGSHLYDWAKKGKRIYDEQPVDSHYECWMRSMNGIERAQLKMRDRERVPASI